MSTMLAIMCTSNEQHRVLVEACAEDWCPQHDSRYFAVFVVVSPDNTLLYDSWQPVRSIEQLKAYDWFDDMNTTIINYEDLGL